MLEGGRDSVNALYNRITRDKRHRDPTLLSYDEIGQRTFAGWSMGQVNMDRLNAALLLRFGARDARPVRGIRGRVARAFQRVVATASGRGRAEPFDRRGRQIRRSTERAAGARAASARRPAKPMRPARRAWRDGARPPGPPQRPCACRCARRRCRRRRRAERHAVARAGAPGVHAAGTVDVAEGRGCTFSVPFAAAGRSANAPRAARQGGTAATTAAMGVEQVGLGFRCNGRVDDPNTAHSPAGGAPSGTRTDQGVRCARPGRCHRGRVGHPGTHSAKPA